MQFFANGQAHVTGSHETTSSGTGGVAGAFQNGVQIVWWRTQNNQLFMGASLDAMQPVPTQLSHNSNGYPIIKAAGVEYFQCR